MCYNTLIIKHSTLQISNLKEGDVMELSRTAEIEQAQATHVEKIQKVKEVDEQHKVVADEEYKKTRTPEIMTEPNEVILDNVKFGYNKRSQDFFVKVTRGDNEYKFPTDQMMKLKAHLLEAMKADAAKKIVRD